MRKTMFWALLFCVATAGLAEAGQFRIAPPQNLRKRPPPRGYRESRLEIVNRDDQGYAIDVDYRRNRLQFEHRLRGDIYVPANSSIVLTFDDDDDWRIIGDQDSLDIQIRAGRTTTLRLETRANRNQVGLFATVDDGRRRTTAQLFKYTERRRPTPPPPPPPPQLPWREPAPPSRGAAIGAIVGGVIGSLVDDGDRNGGRHGDRR